MRRCDLLGRLALFLGFALGQARIRLEEEISRHRPLRKVGSDGIDPSSLGGFIRNTQHLPERKPAITGRQSQGEAGFVFEDEINLAYFPLFCRAANSVFLVATCSVSCLCLRL